MNGANVNKIEDGYIGSSSPAGPGSGLIESLQPSEVIIIADAISCTRELCEKV